VEDCSRGSFQCDLVLFRLITVIMLLLRQVIVLWSDDVSSTLPGPTRWISLIGEEIIGPRGS